MLSRKFFNCTFVASFFVFFIGIILFFLFLFPISITKNIDISSVRQSDGFSYIATAPDSLHVRKIFTNFLNNQFDSNEVPAVSKTKLLENGSIFGIPHSMHIDIANSGFGRYSFWNGNIIFSTTDNSSPLHNGRTYSIEYVVFPKLWLSLVLIVVGAIGLGFCQTSARYNGNKPIYLTQLSKTLLIVYRLFTISNQRYIFLGVSALLWLYLNIVFAKLLPVPLFTPDSLSYIDWSIFRTIGYPATLKFYLFAFREGLTHLPIFQLNLLLVGLFGLSYALVHISNSYTIGWLFLVLVLSAGNMLLSAADVMTEAVFSSLIMIHLASICFYIIYSKYFYAVIAGLAIAIAILVKSVAIVFLVPLVLFVLLTYGYKGKVLIFILPAIIAWLAPSAYNSIKNGFFESSILGGYALSGHVAWAIRPYSDSLFPVEAKLIEHRLDPILKKRPTTFADIDQYISYTANEYNSLLWANIVPELNNYYSNVKNVELMRQENKTLFQLSKEAILNNISQYAYHVFAHFYGMLKYVFYSNVNFFRGTIQRAQWVPAAYNAGYMYYKKFIDTPPSCNEPIVPATSILDIENSSITRIIDAFFLSDLLGCYIPNAIYRNSEIVFAVSIIASLLIFRLRKISNIAKVFCYTGLLVNSYSLGTALAQPALARYAWAMQGVVAALLFLGLTLVVSIARKLTKSYLVTVAK